MKKSLLLKKMTRQEQESAAYEALLEALAFVSFRDQHDDDKDVTEHVLEYIQDPDNSQPVPYLSPESIIVCDNFRSISAKFKIKDQWVTVSTDPPERLAA